jgi:hypothetical protein
MSYPYRALKRVSVRLAVQLIAGCVVLASGAAHAANLGFLNNTPITYMKQPDLQALNQAAHSALDTKQVIRLPSTARSRPRIRKRTPTVRAASSPWWLTPRARRRPGLPSFASRTAVNGHC